MSILPAPSFLVTWPPASPSLEKSWHKGCFPLLRAERGRGTKKLSKALSLSLLPPVMVVSQSGLQPVPLLPCPFLSLQPSPSGDEGDIGFDWTPGKTYWFWKTVGLRFKTSDGARARLI